MDCSEYIQFLTRKGVTFPVVYDIGAWKGFWSSGMKANILPSSQFYLFEANPTYEADLFAAGFPYHIGVLGRPGIKEVNFYPGANTGDSYYKEATTWYQDVAPVRTPCRTLSSVVLERKWPFPDLVKLDTQGSELDILHGLPEEWFSCLKAVIMECPVVEYNQGAPGLDERVKFMRRVGFDPTALVEEHHRDGILVQVDLVFLRSEIKSMVFGPTTHLRLEGNAR